MRLLRCVTDSQDRLVVACTSRCENAQTVHEQACRGLHLQVRESPASEARTGIILWRIMAGRSRTWRCKARLTSGYSTSVPLCVLLRFISKPKGICQL
jgi:hypothetical protein